MAAVQGILFLSKSSQHSCSSDMNQESYARMSGGIEASEALQEWRRQRLLAIQEPNKAVLDSHLQAQSAAMATYDTAMAEALG